MTKRNARFKGPVFKRLVPTSESRELDIDVIDELCATVAAGNFRYVAVQRAGVSQNRLKIWLERAKKERQKRDKGEIDPETPSIYIHLIERLEQAEGEVHAKCVEDVLSSDDARLKMEYLKLRFNKLYTSNPNARIDDESATEVKVDARELLRERLLAILGPPDDG